MNAWKIAAVNPMLHICLLQTDLHKDPFAKDDLYRGGVEIFLLYEVGSRIAVQIAGIADS